MDGRDGIDPNETKTEEHGVPLLRIRGLTSEEKHRSFSTVGIGLATVAGLLLMADAAWKLSATYDEVTYLEVARVWWLHGDQQAISRMGSPLTFWKIQQAPMLLLLETLDCGTLIQQFLKFQNELLPLMRISSFWIWAVALWLTASWARSIFGPSAGVLAAWIFALSPNLLAHGGLITMEMPLIAAATGSFWAFSLFLNTGRRSLFVASAVAAGLAFACKFTAVGIPVLIALPWFIKQVKREPARPLTSAWSVFMGLILFGVIMLATDGVLTGGATITASEGRGEHPMLMEKLGPGIGAWVSDLVERPWPQDWVAFCTQMRFQRSGGPSYLLGERREQGWLIYYPVAMAVKVPLVLAVLAGLRLSLRTSGDRQAAGRMLTLVPITFLILAAVGSNRNYGIRYLLMVSPLVIVWLSALATARGWIKNLSWASVVLLAATSLSIRPNYLSYFNELAGGPVGGRFILADSNLDWGQGAGELARLQQARPDLKHMTTYYFGSVDAGWFRVQGIRYLIDAGTDHPGLPANLEWTTPYLAVSSSLQWGPWGPTGYFESLNGLTPEIILPGATMAIYRKPIQLAPSAP